MRWMSLGWIALTSLTYSVFSQETATVRVADAFDFPVGLKGEKKYYRARGYRPNGHLGEDWNGAGGGDTDLGDPVFATAHGLVMFARDYRLGWGNVIILRHAYQEAGEIKFCDSLYGHLNEMNVAEGQLVTRGQKIGTIGTNRGMYAAHLHFELRKNLQIGMHRSSFARDFTNYFDPTEFITTHRTLLGGGMAVAVPINTYAATPPPPSVADGPANPATSPSTPVPAVRREPYKVNRFEDLRGLGSGVGAK